jgi:catechol 2,3-dioxygenase-like lactoylglutathione lyase family enzyme
MRFHHMAIFVSDMAEALRLWRDVLGFQLLKDDIVPDGPAPGPRVYLWPGLLNHRAPAVRESGHRAHAPRKPALRAHRHP